MSTHEKSGRCQICSQDVQLATNGKPVKHQFGADPCYGSRMKAQPASTALEQSSAYITQPAPAVARTTIPHIQTRTTAARPSPTGPSEDIPPGAKALTAGIALVLGSGGLLAIGFMIADAGGSEGVSLAWIFIGALVQLAGYIAIVLGINRFARRADAAYDSFREQHAAWRQLRAERENAQA